MTEKQLISEIKKGNSSAFRELYYKYSHMVFQTALGLLHHKENAEDVLQDVFVDVFHSIEKFQEKAKFSTWLYRITINKSLNFLRNNEKHKNLKIHQPDDESKKYTITNLVDESPTPQHQLEQKENEQVIHTAIDSLPENQKIAFVLSKYNELSYTEIAETMQISISSVESLLFRAKKGLQKKLIEFYKNF